MAGAEAEADEEEGSDLAPLLSGSTGRRAEVSPPLGAVCCFDSLVTTPKVLSGSDKH